MLNVNLLSIPYSILLLTANFIHNSHTCAATVPGTPPNLDPNCNMCSLDTITLTPGDPDDGTTTATVAGPSVVNGCQQITVTCTGINGGMTFMQFNIDEGGPLQPIGTVVNADLQCLNGQWLYRGERIITEVNCVTEN